MATSNFYSRTIKDQTVEKSNCLLKDHLERVSSKAKKYGNKFESSSITSLAGLWHDLGKYSEEFQKALRNNSNEPEKANLEELNENEEKNKSSKTKPDHSTAGALLALEKLQDENNLAILAAAISIISHHGGLKDFIKFKERAYKPEKKKLLEECKQKAKEDYPELLNDYKLELPNFLTEQKDKLSEKRFNRLIELWIRFCFSCLIDADRLDAALDGEPDKIKAIQQLQGNYSSLAELQNKLDKDLNKKRINSEQKLKESQTQNKNITKAQQVHNARQLVLEHCLEAAKQINKKCFSLTVPTGGGKTLASMKFALDYALNKNAQLPEEKQIKKIIVVIPYTSIIEQNAKVYKGIFGEENVLEHHSNLDPAKENELNRLVTDNWDAPIIVTTSVQFFESLFANKPSKCRKLHNITNSIIIFDEVQTFPVNLLEPILEVLNDLKEFFGIVPVFCTATQPAFSKNDLKDFGSNNIISGLALDIEPIIAPDEQKRIFADLERVKFEIDNCENTKANSELAFEASKHQKVLLITDKRNSAKEIYEELKRLKPDDSLFHLSALMCPVHREEVLEQIKARLNHGLNCRVIATQLIEAGVDIDFPVVIRVLAGFDSIAQSAGRCNREGKEDFGRVFVYKASEKPPKGILEKTRTISESLLKRIKFQNQPEDFINYFKELYFISELDASGINYSRSQWNFEDTAAKFKLIEENTISVIVLRDKKIQDQFNEFKQVKDQLSNLNKIIKLKQLKKSLQRYTVNIYSNEKINKTNLDKLYADSGFYDENFGLIIDLSLTSHEEIYDKDIGLNINKLPNLPNLEVLIA